MVRHSSSRFVLLEIAAQGILRDAQPPKNFDASLWSVTLELSNRQGVMTNWIRAGRAYRTRERFLFSYRGGTSERELISPIPDIRKELLKLVFPEKNGRSLDFEEIYQESRAKELFEPVEPTGGKYLIVGPRSLKMARKSAIHSLGRK
jgi:hypothetical protein